MVLRLASITPELSIVSHLQPQTETSFYPIDIIKIQFTISRARKENFSFALAALSGKQFD